MGDEIWRYAWHIIVGPSEDLRVDAEKGYKGKAKVRENGGTDLYLPIQEVVMKVDEFQVFHGFDSGG
ncbi:unnamed protein product [Prunus armeniaca]